ncbi:hypothetical protein BDR03DRAFT_967725, partial [Suillus americanus]
CVVTITQELGELALLNVELRRVLGMVLHTYKTTTWILLAMLVVCYMDTHRENDLRLMNVWVTHPLLLPPRSLVGETETRA